MRPSLHQIVLSLAAVLLTAVVGISSADAQRGAATKGSAKAGSAVSDSDRVLDGAAKSLEAGNADAAMTALENLLKAGGLANNHMARALYLRGLAHSKKGRPAQAIADLTSAIWLKDGLGEKDRNAALSARSELSREVGIATPASGSTTAPEAVAAAESAPAAQPVPRTRSRASNSMDNSLSEAGFTRSFAPTPATPPPATSEAPAAATSSWQSTTTVDGKAARKRASEVAEARAPASAPPAANPPPSGGGIGSFFSGLFTGSPSASAPAETPRAGDGDSGAWNARTERVAKSERPAGTAAERPAKPFRDVAVRDTSDASRATPQPARITTSALPRGGAYRLQLATVRSRKEADTLAARLRKEHAKAVGDRQLEIDETVFGNMGTFYRVRLGPYADVKEPQLVCEQLRPRGYDCLVVTN